MMTFSTSNALFGLVLQKSDGSLLYTYSVVIIYLKLHNIKLSTYKNSPFQI
jgi:hypothetical protein